MTEHIEFYKRHLPHWHPEGAIFFVTIRLADSLPKNVIESLKAQRQHDDDSISVHLDLETQRKSYYLNDRKDFQRWDTALAIAEMGPKWLVEPDVTAVIVEALHYRHKSLYDLHAYCIM